MGDAGRDLQGSQLVWLRLHRSLAGEIDAFAMIDRDWR
jgi:hypothetical protein